MSASRSNQSKSKHFWKFLLLGLNFIFKPSNAIPIFSLQSEKASNESLGSHLYELNMRGDAEVASSTMNLLQKMELLEAKQGIHMDKMNQPITITELFVNYPRQQSFGESKHKTVPKQHRVDRLLEHITKIMGIAAKEHADAYYNKDGLKEDELNTITRLSFNEFALYTKDTPLSEDEFHFLIAEVETYAKMLLDNLHIVLASIPVGLNGKSLLNNIVYIECGSIPKITIIAKSNPIEGDAIYKNYHLYGETERGHSFKGYSSRGKVISTQDAEGRAINFNPIFEVKTAGGAKLIIAAEICWDHMNNHAKRAFLDLFKRLEENSLPGEYIPLQRNHLIISNTMIGYEDSMISTLYTQADPVSSGVRFSDSSTLTTPLDLIHQEPQPSFGPSYTISRQPEYQLGLSLFHQNKLDKRTKEVNQKLMNNRVSGVLKR